jgi:hypothetical protein
MHRGKLVILLMVLIGCAMGGISVAFHHWLARRAIAWWGRDNVELITRAPRVAAIELRAATESESGETVMIDGERYSVTERKDVGGAEGMDHLRHGLVEDGNFDWERRLPGKPWQCGLEFQDGAQRLDVVFNLKDRCIGRSDSSAVLPIAPVATGWSEFFAAQFPEPRVGGLEVKARKAVAK